MTKRNNIESSLLVAFLSLLCFPLLYIFRVYDTNTLTSWRWVFSAGLGLEKIILLLILSVLASFFLARHIAFEKRPIFTLTVLTIVTVLPLWPEPELLLDSSRYFLQAKHIARYGPVSFIREWGENVSAWTDMPLIPFLYGLIFKFCGETRAAIQLFNTVTFLLTVIFTFLVGREIWDEEVGLYGALLLLGIPYLPTQVPLMLVDIHTMFFITVSVFTFLKVMQRGGFYWIAASSLSLVCAILTKYSSLPMLMVIPLTSLVFFKKNGAVAIYRTALVALLSGCMAGALLIFKFDAIQKQINTLISFQWPALSLWQEGFVSTFLFQTHPFISLLALYAVYKAIRRQDSRFLIIGSFPLLIVLLEMKRIRYMLPILPLFTLMASYGLCTIQDMQLKRFVSCTILSSSLVILLGAYLPFFKSTSIMNLKNAGLYLNTLDSEAVEVCVVPQELSEGNTAMAIPQLDLFTDKKLIARNWPTADKNNLPPFSPLRFSWEIKKPLFYSLPEKPGAYPLVVISGSKGEKGICDAIPGKRPDSPDNEFHLETRIFRYKTLVDVYR